MAPITRVPVGLSSERRRVSANCNISDAPDRHGSRQAVGRCAAGDIEEHLAAGRDRGTIVIRYAVVIEHGPTSFGAYVPDLPGCVAVGKSVAEVKRLIAEAIDFHLEGLKLLGSPIPEPTSIAEYVEAHLPVA